MFIARARARWRPTVRAAPAVGSSVTRTPVIGGGTLGGVSVAAVTRPAVSGANVPALTARSDVSSQI
jgi:hypothetical protein